MTECCMAAKKTRKGAIHFLKDIFRDTTQQKENVFYTLLLKGKNNTGRESLCSPSRAALYLYSDRAGRAPHDVLPPFVRCPGLCTQDITRPPCPTVCTFVGPSGIFVHILSKTYILYFQGTTQLRQFYLPGRRSTQKTAACISGASHKNLRCALPALSL